MRAASSSKGAANVQSENARASFQRSIAGKIGSVSVAANAIAGTASAGNAAALVTSVRRDNMDVVVIPSSMGL